MHKIFIYDKIDKSIKYCIISKKFKTEEDCEMFLSKVSLDANESASIKPESNVDVISRWDLTERFE